jgi:flagellar hook protein FlgE
MAFNIDTASINAASMRLEVIGNNISNSNTSGFKSSQFDEVLATSMKGSSGNKVAGTRQSFTQGNITSTSNPLDMAISGSGFFRVVSNGVTAYTRNGQFMLNKGGDIVNSTGDQLTGFGVDSSGKILTGLPVKMSISAADYLPKATTTAALSLTLDIRKAAIPTTPVFNAGDPSTYTHSTTTSVYDASGTQVDVQTFYVKRSATTWDVYGSVGGNMLSTNAGLMGTLTFNSSGVLASSTTPAATPVATKSLGVYTVPVGASSVNFDMSNTVQFGTSFAATMTQDGSPPGQMVGYKMSTDGVITASYSNGQTATMGQVVLASFKSADGLASAANNQWLETTASGQASLNTAGAGGLGILQASATEDANVDLTSEMIKMISAQRVFQAAAEMVKKQDQIMQTVVNIGQ